jgi:hypothetical protein
MLLYLSCQAPHHWEQPTHNTACYHAGKRRTIYETFNYERGEQIMTKVRFLGPIGGFSGDMDGIVFADTEKKNRTSAYKKKNRAPSEAQLAVQARIAKAARRAKKKLEDPALRELYEMIAQERDSLAHLVAIRDLMVPPTFLPLDFSEYKGKVGDQISVEAKDDIGLASVIFTLTAVDGTRIEQGPAVEDGVRSGDWIYIATVPVPLGTDIFVEARGVDHAGNKTVVSANPIVGEDA